MEKEACLLLVDAILTALLQRGAEQVVFQRSVGVADSISGRLWSARDVVCVERVGCVGLMAHVGKTRGCRDMGAGWGSCFRGAERVDVCGRGR